MNIGCFEINKLNVFGAIDNLKAYGINNLSIDHLHKKSECNKYLGTDITIIKPPDDMENDLWFILLADKYFLIQVNNYIPTLEEDESSKKAELYHLKFTRIKPSPLDKYVSTYEIRDGLKVIYNPDRSVKCNSLVIDYTNPQDKKDRLAISLQ